MGSSREMRSERVAVLSSGRGPGVRILPSSFCLLLSNSRTDNTCHISAPQQQKFIMYKYLLWVVENFFFGDGSTLKHGLPLGGQARETGGRVKVHVYLVLHVVGCANTRVLGALLECLHPVVNLRFAISLVEIRRGELGGREYVPV